MEHQPAVQHDAVYAALARNARAPITAIAKEAGLSTAAARREVQRILATSADVVGVVHPKIFGLTAYGHVVVRCRGRALDAARDLAALPDIRYLALVAGGADLVAELRSADMGSLAASVGQITALPGVARVDTNVYTEIVKDTMTPSATLRPLALDDTDRALLALLQQDGRASYADLGDEVGLSLAATRARVLRLLEAGVVQFTLRARPGTGGPVNIGLGIRTTADAAKAGAELAAFPEIIYVATAMGSYGIVGTLQAPDMDAAVDALDRVRSLPGVGAVDSWTHLRLVKEQYLSAGTGHWPRSGG